VSGLSGWFRITRSITRHGGAAVVSIAPKIGCVPRTLHEWVKKAEVDSGKRAGAPQGLAIHRYDTFGLADTCSRPEADHKRLERRFEGFRIEHTENGAERVVAWYPVLQHQNRTKQTLLGAAKLRHRRTVPRPAQRGHKDNEQNLQQFVTAILCPWAGQIPKSIRKNDPSLSPAEAGDSFRAL